jgi:hypothetical protein
MSGVAMLEEAEEARVQQYKSRVPLSQISSTFHVSATP